MTTSHRFPKSHRLGGRGKFVAIRNDGIKSVRPPLAFWALPNGLAFNRMGISIGRPVGNAVLRNRVKRLLRESFRQFPPDFPRGYDLLVMVRPHKPLNLVEYKTIMSLALTGLHAQWVDRRSKNVQ
jgi:ribonuclease P protein component